jgi:putative SOS response-associated peptidase YedK
VRHPTAGWLVAIRSAFKERRCINFASGFFEWTGDKGNKQPHMFTAADCSPVPGFAGL